MSNLKSWFPIPKSSHFSLANLPFGIISTPSNNQPRPAVAVGDHCLDLKSFAAGGGFEGVAVDKTVFSSSTLNAFASLGRPIHRVLRARCLVAQDQVQMHLPMQIGDYTDFYGCKNHAYNVGCLFRGPENALQPNYLHLPVAYHGRASTVVVSGTPVIRPNGQILENSAIHPRVPLLSPSRRLDMELELGAFVCQNNSMGTHIPISEAASSIFGVVLLNDWSARDIQAWEYVPLGPFNAKNFCTTISPWVVLADALEPFRCKGIDNSTQLLPYLQEKEVNNVYDIRLQADLQSCADTSSSTIIKSNGKHLTYSFAQMLAHHSIGGCALRVGDLIGSGTLSGLGPGTQGSLLEITNGGKHPIKLDGGAERVFLEDGDTVTISGVCGSEETGLVGFGNCIGTIFSAPKI